MLLRQLIPVTIKYALQKRCSFTRKGISKFKKAKNNKQTKSGADDLEA